MQTPNTSSAPIEPDDFSDWIYEPPSGAKSGLRSGPDDESDSRPRPSASSPVAFALSQPASAPQTPKPFPFSNKPDHFPAFFARSALFRTARGTRPADREKTSEFVEVPAAGCDLLADGPSLSIEDKRVYESVVRIAKRSIHDLNDPLTTSLRDLASEMGMKGQGGRSLGWVADSLVRIGECDLKYRLMDRIPRQGKMFASVAISPSGVSLEFDPQFILPAFGIDKQFRIDTARRLKLAHPLARWLHDYLSTHSVAADLTVGYLRGMCGYGARSSSFPQRLNDAMQELASHAPEIAFSHKLLRTGRSSDLWALQYVRGVEGPDFFNPAQMIAAKNARAKAPAKGADASGSAKPSASHRLQKGRD
jgi:hypothetical protein